MKFFKPVVTHISNEELYSPEQIKEGNYTLVEKPRFMSRKNYDFMIKQICEVANMETNVTLTVKELDQ